MKYRHIGGLEVSQFSLGTWHLPLLNRKTLLNTFEVDSEKSIKMFKKAFDLGINFFDTANTYNGATSNTEEHPEISGTSERILGEFIREMDRESLVIATKVRAEMGYFPNSGGLSRKHISWQIGESLKRLQTDYADIYQVHWEDEFTPARETMGILNDLIHRGCVHYIGTSNHSSARVKEMLAMSEKMGWERFYTLQEPYNLLHRSFEEDLAELAKKNNIALLAYVPLAQGLLTGKYAAGTIPEGSRGSYIEGFGKSVESSRKKVDEFLSIAREMNAEPSQVALSWLLKMQGRLGIIIIPILGATDISHLESNVAALDIRLSDYDFQRMNSIAGKTDSK